MGAFDGNGNFVRSFSWVSDKTNGIPITSSRVDTEDTGFASGLTLCTTRDGQGKMAAHFQPSANATYDLGQNALQWRNGFFSGNLTVGGSVAAPGGISGPFVPQVFQKQVAQTVTNSATAAIDTALQSGTLAQGTYQFEFLLYAGNASPGGLRVIPTVSTSIVSGEWVEAGLSNSVSTAVAQNGIAIGGSPAGVTITSTQASGDWYRVEGYFSTSSTTATFALWWCQATANATGTTLAKGSYLKLTQVNASFF